MGTDSGAERLNVPNFTSRFNKPHGKQPQTSLYGHLTHHELLNYSASVANTYASTGISFTLSKVSIVKVNHSYSNTLPVAVGIKISESASAGSLAYTENYGNEESVGSIAVLAVLNPGTYYIWAKGKIAATNNISLDIYALLS